MTNFAIYSGTTVMNVIVATSLEIAEEVTGMSAVETTGIPWIGWTLHGDEWRPPMPTTEGIWEWNDTTHEWIDTTPASALEE